MTDRYLSVDEVAELLGTSARFPRRLIEERRIRYVKVGRHVRIPQSAVDEYIAARTVQPIRLRSSGLRRAA
ncbi:excisionase family DNA-binding protein [Streptomyces sp. HUAS ZL42]|uniref:excisionase family DNA-binding protein n=1 Tax=Streptomyces sp. HUAS ZL42 TaxID=3231715 RepID=UPI00345E4C9E